MNNKHVSFPHTALDISAFDASGNESVFDILRELTPDFNAWTKSISSAYLGCWARGRWEEAIEFAESNQSSYCVDKLIELAFGLRLDDTLIADSENIESFARAIANAK